MKKFKEIFTIKKNDGTEVTLAVKSPSMDQVRKGRLQYNKIFAQMLKEGALLRSGLWAYLRQQNLWNDDMQNRLNTIVKEFSEARDKLNAGGIKLREGIKLAMRMRVLREEMSELQSEYNKLSVNTAEGQADNTMFNSLLSMCLVYNNTGEPYYKDMDTYLECGDDPEATKGAELFAKEYYGWDEKYVDTLPENQWLKKWKLCNDSYQLVNKEGKLVDDEGRLINEDGRFIDKDNNMVDIDGKPVNADGTYKVESAPFLDDDGNPLEEPTGEPVKKEKNKKSTSSS